MQKPIQIAIMVGIGLLVGRLIAPLTSRQLEPERPATPPDQNAAFWHEVAEQFKGSSQPASQPASQPQAEQQPADLSEFENQNLIGPQLDVEFSR